MYQNRHSNALPLFKKEKKKTTMNLEKKVEDNQI